MSVENSPQVTILLWLMAASVAAGLLVLFPPFERFWASWLRSSRWINRALSLALYFLAAFLLPFSLAALTLGLLLRAAAINSLFLSAPWQVRLLCFLFLLIPLWLFAFRILLRSARTLGQPPEAS
jgi:hypothetical protein